MANSCLTVLNQSSTAAGASIVHGIHGLLSADRARNHEVKKIYTCVNSGKNRIDPNFMFSLNPNYFGSIFGKCKQIKIDIKPKLVKIYFKIFVLHRLS